MRNSINNRQQYRLAQNIGFKQEFERKLLYHLGVFGAWALTGACGQLRFRFCFLRALPTRRRP